MFDGLKLCSLGTRATSVWKVVNLEEALPVLSLHAANVNSSRSKLAIKFMKFEEKWESKREEEEGAETWPS